MIVRIKKLESALLFEEFEGSVLGCLFLFNEGGMIYHYFLYFIKNLALLEDCEILEVCAYSGCLKSLQALAQEVPRIT